MPYSSRRFRVENVMPCLFLVGVLAVCAAIYPLVFVSFYKNPSQALCAFNLMSVSGNLFNSDYSSRTLTDLTFNVKESLFLHH